MTIFGRRYRTVNVEQARELIASGSTLVDVRSEREWASGHVDGALHVPLDRLETRLAELPIDTPIVAVCHSGVRSALAARRLGKLGYTVASVRGGMFAWSRSRAR
jgi:rhodanese-related sulfurtransferase